MSVRAPHFLLFSEARRPRTALGDDSGQWSFTLEAVDGSQRLDATDAEPEEAGERLELLAVIRGLEALDQPSRVTLVTPSQYVTRGLRYGLEAWRENDWQWEHFGRMVPVKNSDLWQRLARALNYHRVECRNWRMDEPAAETSPDSAGRATAPNARTGPRKKAWGQRAKGLLQAASQAIASGVRAGARACGSVSQRGSAVQGCVAGSS